MSFGVEHNNTDAAIEIFDSDDDNVGGEAISDVIDKHMKLNAPQDNPDIETYVPHEPKIEMMDLPLVEFDPIKREKSAENGAMVSQSMDGQRAPKSSSSSADHTNNFRSGDHYIQNI